MFANYTQPSSTIDLRKSFTYPSKMVRNEICPEDLLLWKKTVGPDWQTSAAEVFAINFSLKWCYSRFPWTVCTLQNLRSAKGYLLIYIFQQQLGFGQFCGTPAFSQGFLTKAWRAPHELGIPECFPPDLQPKSDFRHICGKMGKGKPTNPGQLCCFFCQLTSRFMSFCQFKAIFLCQTAFCKRSVLSFKMF